MKTLHETETLRYEIFDLNSLDGMAEVVGKAFTASDPMAIAKQLAAKDFTDYIKLLGKWAEREELTVLTLVR